MKCGAILCDDCAINSNYVCRNCGGGANDKPKITKIRRSDIVLYQECPYSYYLKNVEGVSQFGNIYSENGILLHDLFDKDSNSGFQPGENTDQRKDRMLQEYAERFKTIPLERFENCQKKLTIEKFKQQEYDKGLKNIDGYFALTSELPSPYRTEEKLIVPIKDSTIELTITFDRVNKNADGTFDMLDYKTGKVFVGQKLNNDIQAGLYTYAYEHVYPDERINRFVFLFTGENKVREFIRISDNRFECYVGKKTYGFNISDKVEEAYNVFQSVEMGMFDYPQNLHPWHCQNQCEYYHRNICKGKFKERWK